MAEPATRPCLDCKRETSVDKDLCQYCNCNQTFQPCVACGHGIRKGASLCNDCKSYQDFRQYFGVSVTVLSILTAMIAMFAPAIRAYSDYRNRNSNTAMIVKDADATGVYVYFRNSGHETSQLAHAQLIFDAEVPLKPIDLQPAEIGNTLVRPNEPVTIVLRLTGGLERTRNVPDEEILQQIRKKKVKLRCVIAESDNPEHTLPDADVPDRGAHDLIAEGMKTS